VRYAEPSQVAVAAIGKTPIPVDVGTSCAAIWQGVRAMAPEARGNDWHCSEPGDNCTLPRRDFADNCQHPNAISNRVVRGTRRLSRNREGNKICPSIDVNF
jgi:hypothetical protein